MAKKSDKSGAPKGKPVMAVSYAPNMVHPKDKINWKMKGKC